MGRRPHQETTRDTTFVNLGPEIYMQIGAASEDGCWNCERWLRWA